MKKYLPFKSISLLIVAGICFSEIVNAKATYVVKKSDALSMILYRRLKNLGVHWAGREIYGPSHLLDQTVSLNPWIENPDLIQPGKEIVLPRYFEDVASRVEKDTGKPQLEIKIEHSPLPTVSPSPSVTPTPSPSPSPLPSLIESQPTSQTAKPTVSTWEGEFALGVTRSDRSETIGGNLTHTNGVWGLPSLSARVTRNQNPTPGNPFWSYCLFGEIQRSSGPSVASLPWEGSFGGQVSRENYWHWGEESGGKSIAPSLGVEWQSFSQATPNLSNSTSTTVPFSTRSTHALWVEIGAKLSFYSAQIPTSFQLLLAYAPNASSLSSAPQSTSYSMNGFKIEGAFQLDFSGPLFARAKAGAWSLSGDQSSSVSGQEAGLEIGIRF